MLPLEKFRFCGPRRLWELAWGGRRMKNGCGRMGKKIRNGLWWPLLKARRLQRVDLADANGGDNGDAAGSEDSADEDV